MNSDNISKYNKKVWQESIIPTLQKYIEIPNKSPMFDKHWQQNGYMHEAVELFKAWAIEHAPKDMHLEVIEEAGRTPLIYIDIPGQKQGNPILLYGHLDKQPEMEGWDEGLEPWEPVILGNKLYGRGGADDGYAMFAAITAINSLQEQDLPHSRCVIVIEASEESGSYDLPYYMAKLKERIGNPGLIICLDSGCGNYEQMWLTTSLRGILGGRLRVQISKEGVHSGMATGIVPSSFRIIRQLLDRIEDPLTGEILLKELHAKIPQERIQQSEQTSKVLGHSIYEDLPFVESAKPVSQDLQQLLLNNTWKPALAITGVSGIPAMQNAGNVLRPFTELKLSMRLPPTVNAVQAGKIVKKELEQSPPYGAIVEFIVEDEASGWNAPASTEWLLDAVGGASKTFFNKSAQYMGEGGSIPFMGMLGELFPMAQFVITGVLGPKSNAHGPNEFLHLEYAESLTGSVAHIIDRYSKI